ncbi:MAG TPA: methyltransferase [Bacteroidia bacterium]
MRLLLKKLAYFLSKPILKIRLRSFIFYKYENITVQINPGVFHPKYYSGTKYLLNYLQRFDLAGKTFCEPGMGCGIISIWAAQQFANVTCFDISKAAFRNTKTNYFKNEHLLSGEENFHIYRSDLFDRIPGQTFDYIVINPPTIFKDPGNEKQQGRYCGKEGQFFKKLFYQLPEYSHEKTKIFMLLTDSCDIEKIKSIARIFGYSVKIAVSKKIWWEWNYIFKLTLVNNSVETGQHSNNSIAAGGS